MTLEANSFTKLPYLEKVAVKNSSSLTLLNSSFLNPSQRRLRLEIDGVNRVEIESKSFYILREPITLLIRNCQELIIHSNAVPRIAEVSLTDVQNVQFGENAFSQLTEKARDSHQRSTSKVSKNQPSFEILCLKFGSMMV